MVAKPDQAGPEMKGKYCCRSWKKKGYLQCWLLAYNNIRCCCSVARPIASVDIFALFSEGTIDLPSQRLSIPECGNGIRSFYCRAPSALWRRGFGLYLGRLLYPKSRKAVTRYFCRLTLFKVAISGQDPVEIPCVESKARMRVSSCSGTVTSMQSLSQHGLDQKHHQAGKRRLAWRFEGRAVSRVTILYLSNFRALSLELSVHSQQGCGTF
jgi:hypothetical protein